MVFLLGGCDPGSEVLGKQWPAYRYKLAATVDTPQGARSGYSVIEVAWHKGSSVFGSMRSSGYSYHAQAVAVDLPRGQTLFILPRTKDDVDWPAYALRGVVKDLGNVAGEDRLPHPVPRTIRIIVDDIPNYPWFIRFRDIRDPATVEEVDPDNLAHSFGRGFKLKSLTVQLTDEPISQGITDRLPWWRQHVDRHLDGTSSEITDLQAPNVSAFLNSRSFSTDLPD